MKPYAEAIFQTNTATLAVFDPVCLIHKIAAPCDWWSIPEDEVREVNLGNVIFAALGSDGTYSVNVFRYRDGEYLPPLTVRANLNVQSGSVYIGAGENVIAAGFGPGTTHGGMLMMLECGVYEIGLMCNPDAPRIDVHLIKSKGNHRNNFSEGIQLCA